MDLIVNIVNIVIIVGLIPQKDRGSVVGRHYL